MSFIFNNVDCRHYNLYVEKYPNRSVPNRKILSYSIVGRSGNLIVDQDSYENVMQSYDVFAKGDSNESLQEYLRDISAWLVSVSGYKELRDSYDPDIYRLARVANAPEFINSLNKFGRATIEFDCKPERFPYPQERLEGQIGDTFTYTNDPKLMPAYPIMEIRDIQRNTSFEIEDSNGIRMVFPGETGLGTYIYTIDWETQSAVTSFGNTPRNMSVVGPWDKLGKHNVLPPTSSISTTLDSGTAPKVTIYTRRFYL